jgi:hypothetical protein
MPKIMVTITMLMLLGAFAAVDSVNAQPEFVISKGIFSFHGSEFSPDTLVDTVIITNGGDGTLDWTASWSNGWLDVVPSSGIAPSTVEIRVTAESLARDSYFRIINLECPEATNSPVPLWINFYVSCQGGLCGDANEDASVGLSDAIFLINYVFIPGSPQPGYVLACGDANGDCSVNLSDAVYLINYVFVIGAPPPGDCCAGGWEGQGGDCCPFPG